MTNSIPLSTKQIGQLRIYIPQGETRRGRGLLSLFGGRALYYDIIHLAKADGIINAAAHSTHFGYTRGGRIQTAGAEIPNPHLSMCVELIDDREKLEAFCCKHVDVLRDRILVYKQLELWELSDVGVTTS